MNKTKVRKDGQYSGKHFTLVLSIDLSLSCTFERFKFAISILTSTNLHFQRGVLKYGNRYIDSIVLFVILLTG